LLEKDLAVLKRVQVPLTAYDTPLQAETLEQAERHLSNVVALVLLSAVPESE
jgi:hypothetical protein